MAEFGGDLALEMARFIAIYQKRLTATEKLLFVFYLQLGRYQMSRSERKNAEKKSPPDKELGSKEKSELAQFEILKETEEVICKHFIKAVEDHDGPRIIEIAQAAAYFKGKFSDGQYHQEEESDTERAALVRLRQFIDASRIPMDVHMAVGFVELVTGKTVPGKHSSYRGFRDRCAAMGINLAPVRTASSKK